MKLKKQITEFEGTPEEYERAFLKGLFEPVPAPNGFANSDISDGTNASALPQHAIDFLDNSVPQGDAHAIVEEVIATAVGWGDVSVKPGGGQSAGKYVRLYRRGSPFGAFMYVQPTSGQLRLPADTANGMKYAQARNVVPTNPHQIVVPLDDRAALDEVLGLVRMAYDKAR